MGAMGRPLCPPPDGWEEVYVEHGWEARDRLGMDTPRFKRTLDQAGEELKRKRRNYVMGRRLSSLKLEPRRV